MKIANTIIEEGINEIDNNKKRTTVRGVILNKNKEVLLLYSGMFDDYTFPGGGVKDGEDHIQTLKRELLEEIGATNIEVIKRIGHINEVRYGISGSNSLYNQTSHYYFCKINTFGKTNHIGREKQQQLEARWIKIEDAITHNEEVHRVKRQYEKGFKTVLLRENAVLEHIKELMNA